MIVYRRFRNDDPPKLLKLWNEAGLGRGAAQSFSCDVLDDVSFAQSYFDRNGVLIAEDDGTAVGFVHAGFGPQTDQKQLQPEHGVINLIIVSRAYRRQGIGRELVRQAESYLQTNGAQFVEAGPGKGHAPFYTGLYGGASFSGFLKSDPVAKPFFEAMGYQAKESWNVLQRDLQKSRDPIGVKLLSLRRTTQLQSTDWAAQRSWWWSTRIGRLDSLDFSLILKATGEEVAFATVVGLDYYVPVWQTRAAAIHNLHVDEPHRRSGYGRSMVVELCRRLRDESVQLIEVHVSQKDTHSQALFESAGFRLIDVGTAYRRSLD